MSDTTESIEAAADYSSDIKVREAAALMNKAVKMMPDKGYWTNARKEIEETITYVQERSRVLIAEMEVVEKQMEEAFYKHYERTKKAVKEHVERMNRLKLQVDTCHKTANEVRIPYGAKEFLEIAEKIDSMSDVALDKAHKIIDSVKGEEVAQ